MINKIFNEPCLDTIARMSDDFLDCVITSPPYWQLRDYQWDGQWGLEPTFEQYLENLWSMMDALMPKLKDSGTVWINLGDTYARGSRIKDGTNHTVSKKSKEHHIEPNSKPNYSGLDKCLLLLPHRFAIGCIDRGWIVRNDIIWAKRNGMPESVKDRFSKKHEYFFFMVKNKDYYFDLDIIRDRLNNPIEIRNKASEEYGRGSGSKQFSEGVRVWGNKDKGKNPGTVSNFWDITTKGSSKKHYAAYNMELIRKPILAGCPEGGIIYDPFMGTGNTAIAALKANRKFIGSEGSKDYYDESMRDIKPMLRQPKLF